MFDLVGSIKQYDWGKSKNESLVYNLSILATDLIKKYNNNQKLSESLKFAELWMGTHNSGPSLLKDSEKTLQELIQSAPEKYLGKNYTEKKELPFLFKVLSIENCLSIQTHPDQNLAIQLNKIDPQHYPDANPKPEMCIALNEFEALMGFAPKQEIIEFLKEFEILEKQNDLIKQLESNEEQTIKDALKQFLHDLFQLKQEDLSKIIGNIMKKIEIKENKTRKDILLQNLNHQFQEDIGIIFAGLLNYKITNPGDCFVIDANEPHAYIKGNCIECMACSDNVVRAGLTPKFKDAKTLINMLSYKLDSANEIKPIILNQDKYLFYLYQAQYKEFQCFKLEINEQMEGMTKAITFENPSILIVIEGSGTILTKDEQKNITKGCILFLVPNLEFKFDLNKCIQLFICNAQ